MTNSNFNYERVKQLLDQYSNIYRIPMTITQNRFNSMEYTPQTFDDYVLEIDEFFKNRKKYVIPYMEEVFANNE